MTERVLQRQIVAVINRSIKGCFCVSYYNSGIYNPKLNAFMKKTSDMPKGFPDIVGVINGKPFAIEVKLPKGKVAPHQAAMHVYMESCGWPCRVCRSVNEALAFVKSIDELQLQMREK